MIKTKDLLEVEKKKPFYENKVRTVTHDTTATNTRKHNHVIKDDEYMFFWVILLLFAYLKEIFENTA